MDSPVPVHGRPNSHPSSHLQRISVKRNHGRHRHTTRVAASVPQPDPTTLHGENQAFQDRYMLVPVFTIHNTTVGAGVAGAIETRDSPWLPKGQLSMKVRL